jgi:hypothetical protein
VNEGECDQTSWEVVGVAVSFARRHTHSYRF